MELIIIFKAILVVVAFVLTLFFHELGHYYIAKHRNIYKSFSFNPFKLGKTYVETTNPHKKASDGLYGILFSLIVIPLWIYVGVNWILATFVVISVGLVDIKEYKKDVEKHQKKLLSSSKKKS